MDFSPSSIIAGIIFGAIGFVFFRKGKANAQFTLIVSGILLMTFQLFVSGPKPTWIIGGLLTGVGFYFWDIY